MKRTKDSSKKTPRPFAIRLCFDLEAWGKIPQQRHGVGIPSYDSIPKEFSQTGYTSIRSNMKFTS